MHENNDLTSTVKQVLIYPAQIPKVSDRQVYFLFSSRQVEDILMDAPVLQVPFSPSYVEGVAEWRNCIMPVVSLEAFWGPKSFTSRKAQRLMVVRGPQIKEAPFGPNRIMLRMAPPVHMLTLPIDCTPVTRSSISNQIQTKGIYDWENKILVVADIKKFWEDQK